MLRAGSIALIAVLLSAGLSASARAATPSATYELTFDASWSAATHPIDFPVGPHFSGLVGATHANAASFWQLGAIASAGIESMSETGSKFPLSDEIAQAIGLGTAETLISGGGIGTSPDSVSVEFTASQAFPLLTLVSMIAPSPDWFVGVHEVELFDGNSWVDLLVIDLFPYDAGSDDGSSYASPNADTNPKQPIALIQTPPPGNGVRLGTFTLKRLDAEPVPALPRSGAALLASLLGVFLVLALRRTAATMRGRERGDAVHRIG